MKSINVKGIGEIYRKPDKVIISFQKVSRSKDYDETLNDLNNVINEVVKGLKKLGIDEDSIKTNNFQITAENKYDQDLKENVFLNYKAEHTIEIEVNNDNEEINKVLTFLGENKFSANININFKISDIDGVKEEALILAIEDAKRKAEIIANSLGLKIISVNEVNYNTERVEVNRREYDNILLAKSNNIDFNIMPKDIKVEELVTIVFSIK